MTYLQIFLKRVFTNLKICVNIWTRLSETEEKMAQNRNKKITYGTGSATFISAGLVRNNLSFSYEPKKAKYSSLGNFTQKAASPARENELCQ